MNRTNECVRVFVGVAAFAYALYALTLPDGLPWGISVMMPGTWMVVALSVGLLGSLVTRYLGWRCGAAVALIFTFVPEVWNRTILDDQRMLFVALAICGLWLLNAILFFVFRKAREARKVAKGALASGAEAHAESKKRIKVNGIASWVFLGGAGLFAIVSATMHDYHIGEAATVFAKGVVEEAKARIVVLNGVLDEQVESVVQEGQGRQKKLATISLRSDAKQRMNLVAWVRREWPNETNLHVGAQVSATAFLDVAVKAHPERFYLMNGSSTTCEGWEKRWTAFRPYLNSRNRFVPIGRRLFAYEANYLANAMEARAETYALYKRIFEEVDVGNVSALINMNEMILNGYKVSADEQKWVKLKLDSFFKDEVNRQHLSEIVQICGPIRAKPETIAKLREEATKRMKERLESGNKDDLPQEIKDLFKQNDMMVEAMGKKDRETAGKIAREILSTPGWSNWPPANAVMGEIMSDAGDFVASEAFFRTAISYGTATPGVVLNNYADVLLRMGKLDEAENILRELLAKSNPSVWGVRFTLAEVLSKKVIFKTDVDPQYETSIRKEVSELVAAVIKHAPAEMKKLMREKQSKGEVLR